MLPLAACAQETDTTRQELDLNKKPKNIQQRFDRSMSGGMMSDMGSYDVPNETQYYHRPFKGQEYLDLAVEAYRKEIKNSWQGNWYWQFLKAVSPYIDNTFEFGFYNNDVPIVDRGNPLFQSYKNNDKKQ